MSLFLYLYVMEYSWDDMVEKLNNNDLDVQKYFNDYGTFFSILKKRGLMGEVDPKNASGGEHWQNEYLLWLYENDKENYYKWVPTLLDDVIIENGIAYLEITDRSDLAKLFCYGNRYELSRDTIENILSGDGDVFEPYWDTTQDVYRDVIEELTPENDKRLGEYIVNMLKGQQISADTDELELIASEQGHPEYVEVDMENVKRIIDDEETMKELLDEQLSDLKSELYSIHSSAYNSAYEEEVWAEIWSELGTYFEGDGEWISKPHPYKKNTEIQYFKIPIKDFDAQVNDYLFNNKGYGNTGTLEFHGSFIEIMKEDRDCLGAQSPDYPDSRKVDKNINTYFKEYI
jgi:hypothetical protein